VVEVRLRLLGEDDSSTQTSMSNLGVVYSDWGKLEKAEPWVRRELELCRHAHGDEHPDTLISLNNYAILLERMGRLEQALPVMEQVAAVRGQILGEGHQKTVNSRVSAAVILGKLGRYDEADTRFREAIDGAGDQGASQPHVLRARVLRAETMRNHKPVEAASAFASAVADCRRCLGDGDTLTLYARTMQARSFEEQGRLEEAAQELGAVVAGYDSRKSSKIAEARVLYARVLGSLGRFDLAEREARAALEYLQAEASSHPSVGEAMRELGRLAELRQSGSDAEQWRLRLREWQEAHQQSKASR
jgi:tetratricopeptide (TPR) repeat protein